jgi:alanine racemase
MDQIMVDVTDIPGVALGDSVTLLGRSGDLTITAEEMGAAAGSFNYETVCAITRRVPRVYVQNQKVVSMVNYLL